MRCEAETLAAWDLYGCMQLICNAQKGATHKHTSAMLAQSVLFARSSMVSVAAGMDDDGKTVDAEDAIPAAPSAHKLGAVLPPVAHMTYQRALMESVRSRHTQTKCHTVLCASAGLVQET